MARHVTLLASAARTATPSSPAVLPEMEESGVKVVIDVTAVAATPSVTPKIESYDPTSDKWVTLLTGAAITATGTTTLTVSPHVLAAANVAAQDFLLNHNRVVLTHADADSITYSVSAHFLRH